MHGINTEQLAENKKQVQRSRTENAVMSTRVTMLISGLLLCFTVATGFMGFTYISVSRIEKQVAIMATTYSMSCKASIAHESEQQTSIKDHEGRIQKLEKIHETFQHTI
jgi:small-conductance mechanosensitive channel